MEIFLLFGKCVVHAAEMGWNVMYWGVEGVAVVGWHMVGVDMMGVVGRLQPVGGVSMGSVCPMGVVMSAMMEISAVFLISFMCVF